MSLSGIQVMTICPIIEWSVIQMLLWIADKIVCYLGPWLNNCHYRPSEYSTILSTIQMPFEYQTIMGHLKSEQVKARYSVIQIPTV